jgi:hypothetical protein
MVTPATFCLQVAQQLPNNNIYKTPDRLTENSSSPVDVLKGYPLLLVLWFSGTPLEGRQPIANSCLTAHRLTKELKEEEKGERRAIFYVLHRPVVPRRLFLLLFLITKIHLRQTITTY